MLQLVHLQLVFSSSLSITSRWRINIFLSSGLSRINPQSYNHQFQQTQAWTWHPLLTTESRVFGMCFFAYILRTYIWIGFCFTSFFNQPGSYQCSIAWCNKLHTRFFFNKIKAFCSWKVSWIEHATCKKGVINTSWTNITLSSMDSYKTPGLNVISSKFGPGTKWPLHSWSS